MKAVILAGGYGTRISEESDLKPKPMIEIGGKPILWHILKIYSNYNINDKEIHIRCSEGRCVRPLYTVSKLTGKLNINMENIFSNHYNNNKLLMFLF